MGDNGDGKMEAYLKYKDSGVEWIGKIILNVKRKAGNDGRHKD